MSSSSSSDSEDDYVAVIDTGSGYIKAGWAGEDMPEFTFPAMIGHARGETGGVEYVGEEAAERQESLTLRHPVENGIVTNWDDIETLWAHTYEKLGRAPSDQPVLLTEAPLNPVDNREHMAQIMLEKFNVPGIYVALQAVLSLYSTGRTTGMVLDSGEGVSHSIAIYEGYAPQHAIHRLDLAGRDLTSFLMSLMGAKGVALTTTAGHQIVRDIKEQHCFVSMDYAAEMETPTAETDYTLPDGSTVKLGVERATCPEALFDPELVNMEADGIHKMIASSIARMEVDTRRDLYGSVVLTGGSTMFPNLPERLNAELSAIAAEQVRVKVVAPPDRRYAVWMGGSILGSLSTFQTHMLISKKEYDEVGPSIMHDLRVKL